MNQSQAYGTSPTPASMNQLTGAVKALDYSIGQLEGVLAELRGRLTTVLTPSMPTPTAAGGNQLAAAPPPMSDMTADVCGHSRRIDALAMTLGDVLNRLEV